MVIPRGVLKTYLTGDLFEAKEIWREYRRFGLPHAGGEAAETWEYIALISAFEDELEAFQAERRRK